MTEKVTEYWSWREDCENIHCREEYEAICEFMEDEVFEIEIEESSTVTIYKFVPVKPELDHMDILDDVLVNLDENFGLECVDAPHRTPRMIEAAKTFAEAVLAEYETEACENVEKKTINLYEWCKEHKPELIK